jgi:hypothetical protein
MNQNNTLFECTHPQQRTQKRVRRSSDSSAPAPCPGTSLNIRLQSGNGEDIRVSPDNYVQVYYLVPGYVLIRCMSQLNIKRVSVPVPTY